MDWDDFLQQLFAGRQKEEALALLQKQPGEISTLLRYVTVPDEKLAWRAAWIIDHLNQQAPQLIKPHLSRLCTILKTTSFNGVRRSLMKVLVTNPSPVNEDGLLVDLCFNWMVNPKIPTAVRAHAMKLVYNLLPIYPDLRGEFKTSLEVALEEEAKGVQSCARNLLAKL